MQGSTNSVAALLRNEFVFDGSQYDRLVVLGPYEVTRSRLLRLALAGNNFSARLCFFLLDLIRLDTIEELLTTARVPHMLHPDVDALCQYALPDTLVDNDAKSVLRHVVHDTSATMVHLVWHAFLHCTITTYIDNVSFLVCFHVC